MGWLTSVLVVALVFSASPAPAQSTTIRPDGQGGFWLFQPGWDAPIRIWQDGEVCKASAPGGGAPLSLLPDGQGGYWVFRLGWESPIRILPDAQEGFKVSVPSRGVPATIWPDGLGGYLVSKLGWGPPIRIWQDGQAGFKVSVPGPGAPTAIYPVGRRGYKVFRRDVGWQIIRQDPRGGYKVMRDPADVLVERTINQYRLCEGRREKLSEVFNLEGSKTPGARNH